MKCNSLQNAQCDITFAVSALTCFVAGFLGLMIHNMPVRPVRAGQPSEQPAVVAVD